jgi:hypothetical protein
MINLSNVLDGMSVLISGFRRDVDEICGLLGVLRGFVW